MGLKDLFKRDAAHFFRKGSSALESGQLSVAFAHFNKCLELSETYERTRKGMLNYNVAEQLARASVRHVELLQTAIIYLDRALESMGDTNPFRSVAHLMRGDLRIRRGLIPEAVLDYNECIKWQPDNAEAHNRRGLAYWQTGHVDLAESDLKQAVLLAREELACMQYRASLRRFEDERGRSASSEPCEPAIGPVGVFACPRCGRRFDDKPFGAGDGPPHGSLREVEIMECRRCGVRYCWPDCCRLGPCICGSTEGFVAGKACTQS